MRCNPCFIKNHEKYHNEKIRMTVRIGQHYNGWVACLMVGIRSHTSTNDGNSHSKLKSPDQTDCVFTDYVTGRHVYDDSCNLRMSDYWKLFCLLVAGRS